MKLLLRFHSKNAHVNEPKYNVVRILSILFLVQLLKSYIFTLFLFNFSNVLYILVFAYCCMDYLLADAARMLRCYVLAWGLKHF